MNSPDITHVLCTISLLYYIVDPTVYWTRVKSAKHSAHLWESGCVFAFLLLLAFSFMPAFCVSLSVQLTCRWKRTSFASAPFDASTALVITLPCLDRLCALCQHQHAVHHTWQKCWSLCIFCLLYKFLNKASMDHNPQLQVPALLHSLTFPDSASLHTHSYSPHIYLSCQLISEEGGASRIQPHFCSIGS